MVTNDILEAFRPTIINTECLIPHELNFGKEMLDIINDPWKNYANNESTNNEKNRWYGLIQA